MAVTVRPCGDLHGGRLHTSAAGRRRSRPGPEVTPADRHLIVGWIRGETRHEEGCQSPGQPPQYRVCGMITQANIISYRYIRIIFHPVKLVVSRLYNANAPLRQFACGQDV